MFVSENFKTQELYILESLNSRVREFLEDNSRVFANS